MAREAVVIAELETAAKKATPGRWYPYWRYKDPKRADNGNLICAVAPGHQIRTDAPGGTMPSADMDHIAVANPDTVKRLCAALRAMAEWAGPGGVQELKDEHGIVLDAEPQSEGERRS